MHQGDAPLAHICSGHSDINVEIPRQSLAVHAVDPCPAMSILLQIQGLLNYRLDFNAPSQVPLAAGVPKQDIRADIARFLHIKERQFQAATDLGAKIGSCAWTMLADLYVLAQSGRRTSVTSLCIGARAPATTALRHLGSLVELGFVEREDDERDGRITYVDLTQRGRDAIEYVFGK